MGRAFSRMKAHGDAREAGASGEARSADFYTSDPAKFGRAEAMLAEIDAEAPREIWARENRAVIYLRYTISSRPALAASAPRTP
jgi:hypothetical protein